MHSIPEILEELRAGRMVVLVDDEDRENEGDLIVPARYATPETINFMLKQGRGMMCVALAGAICDHLDLTPQTPANTTQRGTAYTITVDAHERHGITTGVSAADRATTIQLLVNPEAGARDFARPGHIQPLRARDGGVLVRAGQTEGSVDLCKLAGLSPGAVIIEVMNDDGTMARRPQLEALCARHDIKMCSVADIITYRLGREILVSRLDAAPFESDDGRFDLIAYRSLVDPLPHVAMVCGRTGRMDSAGQPIEIDEPVLVRMHSQNLLGDVFGDREQPSGRTLHRAMKLIHDTGEGAVVYLRHEQMGSGLLRRLQTMQAVDEQLIARAERPAIGSSQTTPGMRPPADKRDYGIGSQILRDLGIRRIRLVTDHPFTPTALSGFGLEITEFVPVPRES